MPTYNPAFFTFSTPVFVLTVFAGIIISVFIPDYYFTLFCSVSVVIIMPGFAMLFMNFYSCWFSHSLPSPCLAGHVKAHSQAKVF
jgi:hypothetical protein